MSEKFGQYELVNLLGTGGMAEVFLAHPAGSPHITLAIKRILPRFSRNPKIIQMLVQEASLGVGLIHPNIVRILDFGRIDGIYFIAMEYVEGKDLKSIVRKAHSKQKQLPIPLILHIGIEILRGLDYAHNKSDHYQRPLNIVHRDISPQNIMLSFLGDVKILDFGIAKPTAKPGDPEKGLLKGKIAYMSPEQAHGDDITFASDIFSLGILLWELLTMRALFNGETDLELIREVRRAEVPSPQVYNPAISKDLASLVLKALQKKPSQRYGSAAEMARQLSQYLRERFGILSHQDILIFLGEVYRGELSADKIKANLARLKDRIIQPTDIDINPESSAVRKFSPWIFRRKSRSNQFVSATVKLLFLGAIFFGIYSLTTPKVFPIVDHYRSQWYGIFYPKHLPSNETNDKASAEAYSGYEVQFTPTAREALLSLDKRNQMYFHWYLADFLKKVEQGRVAKQNPRTVQFQSLNQRVSAYIDFNQKRILIEKIK